MTRYEACIEKHWEKEGLAHLLVWRVRDNGSADYAVFLVDLFCLGVKDAFSETDVPEADLREFVNERLPEEFREAFHPACAKKLIEGALAYAESFGFAPHRDFRKARKILSGIDASACPREFTFGRAGRPCYIRGPEDSEERVNRVLAILEARCGADGFDFEDPDADDEEDILALREEMTDFLDAEPDTVPRFYEVSGLITAMLICPTVLSPLKVFEALWGPGGKPWESAGDAQDFAGLLGRYWNHLGNFIAGAVTPDAHPDEHLIDIWEDDFTEGQEGAGDILAANFAWASGFLRATRLWPEAWGDTLARPDLAPHWEIVRWWAGFDERENQDKLVAAVHEEKPRDLGNSVKALTRALRPLGPLPSGFPAPPKPA